MASNFINNLSNTYRGSPSLQNQFATEQDYLDLFDNNKTTPAMAQAYVPVDDTSEIKSITNTTPTIVNQRGGGADTDPTGPTTGFSSQGAPYGDAKGGIHDYSGTGIAGTGITGQGLMAALSFALNPIGFFVGRYAKDTYKAYKEKKEKERIEAAKEAERVAAVQRSLNRGSYVDRDSYGMSASDRAVGGGKGVAGLGSSATDRGSKSAQGYSQHAKGGFVRGSYFNGGIVSLRRR